jgi:hypothetical protein
MEIGGRANFGGVVEGVTCEQDEGRWGDAGEGGHMSKAMLKENEKKKMFRKGMVRAEEDLRQVY